MRFHSLAPGTAADESPGARAGIEATLPDLQSLQMLARRLQLPSWGRVSARLAGGHRSTVRGRGMEFAEVRPYVPGDEVRHIDWRVTARTGTPHSKLFEEERERPALVMADLRGPMRFGTRQCFKSVAAARGGALLAWAARLRGDRVGGISLDGGGLHSLRPHRGPTGANALLSMFAEATRHEAQHAAPALADALREARRIAGAGTEVFVLSDFSDFDAKAAQHMAGLARRAEVTCLMVHDPIESEPPAPGRYRVSDGNRVVVIGLESTPRRAAWSQPFESRLATLEEHCHRTGSGLALLSTASPGLGFQPTAPNTLWHLANRVPARRSPEGATS